MHQLNLADLDFDERFIHVMRGKGSKYRKVPMHPRLAHALNEYLLEREDRGRAVFVTRNGRMARVTMQWVMLQAARDAGVFRDGRPVSIHKLRHTFGTDLSEANVHQSKIQALMGHSSARTTSIYTHPRVSHDDIELL